MDPGPLLFDVNGLLQPVSVIFFVANMAYCDAFSRTQFLVVNLICH